MKNWKLPVKLAVALIVAIFVIFMMSLIGYLGMESLRATSQTTAANATFTRYAVSLGVATVLSIAVFILIGVLLRSYLIAPLAQILRSAKQIAEGDPDIPPNADSSDELGMLSDALRTIAIQMKSHATGMQQILSAASQVFAGANQIHDGSQSLAQGSSQQALAIEQLSRSMAEIALHAQKNVQVTETAAALHQSIQARANESAERISDMVRAVEEINEVSMNISKTLRSINDIAFHTKILSLNAAVEAANAGQHGTGFAVVAGEVRNLAMKSSEAATDTGTLIETSIEKVHFGMSIAKNAREALDLIVADIKRAAALLNDISAASGEQAQGIAQVNDCIDKIALVADRNGSAAEKNAAASEEMAAHASAVKNLAVSFKPKPASNEALSEIPDPLPEGAIMQ